MSVLENYLFDDLLISPLHRAIPLPKTHCVPHLIRKYLDFDVPRSLDELLDKNGGVPEPFERLALSRFEGVEEG